MHIHVWDKFGDDEMRRIPFDRKRRPTNGHHPINPFKATGRGPHFNLDTDNDLVPDWRDCRPFNPRKQHAGPSEYKLYSEEDYEKLYKKLTKKALSHYSKKGEAIGLALSVASRAMEQKKQYKGDLGFEEEEYPRYLKVSYYVPASINFRRESDDSYTAKIASPGFTPLFGPKQVFLEVWDTSTDVLFYVDVTGYAHVGMSFKYSGPVSKDIYHVSSKRIAKPRVVLAISGIDREKLGSEFDDYFWFVEKNMKPL